MVKLKDLVNPKKNKINHQISFDIKKTKMKKLGVKVEDLLDLELSGEKFKW